jgi:hypothetical protein
MCATSQDAQRGHAIDVYSVSMPITSPAHVDSGYPHASHGAVTFKSGVGGRGGTRAGVGIAPGHIGPGMRGPGIYGFALRVARSVSSGSPGWNSYFLSTVPGAPEPL